jgi:hypothetical protein
MSQEHHCSRPAHMQAPRKAGKQHLLSPLWHNRDYLLLWSGQLLSTIGTQISQLAFPLLVLALTFSPAQASLVAALRSHKTCLLARWSIAGIAAK